jgi:hypothetical protein
MNDCVAELLKKGVVLNQRAATVQGPPEDLMREQQLLRALNVGLLCQYQHTLKSPESIICRYNGRLLFAPIVEARKLVEEAFH